MTRPEITKYIYLALRSQLRYEHWRTYREVSIRKVPAFAPVGFSETLHIDMMALEGQRVNGKAPFTILGFEIKSCRDDFAIDTKWKSYFGRVDRLIFACLEGSVVRADVTGTPAGIWIVTITPSGHPVWKKLVHAKAMEVAPEARFDAMYGMAINSNRDTLSRLRTDEQDMMIQLGKQWYKEHNANSQSNGQDTSLSA